MLHIHTDTRRLAFHPPDDGMTRLSARSPFHCKKLCIMSIHITYNTYFIADMIKELVLMLSLTLALCVLQFQNVPLFNIVEKGDSLWHTQ